MKKHAFAVCFTAALIAFTVYITLDTFVLTRSYRDSAGEMNTSMFSQLSTEKIDAQSSASTGQTLGGHGTSSGRRDTSIRRKSFSSERGLTLSGGDTASDSGSAVSNAPSSTDASYQDENVSIALSTYRVNDTTVYVADVTMCSAQYLKTAFANNTYGKNVTATTSSIAQANGAVLAINGDYYGVQEKGYVIRNGIVYRSSAKGADVLCVYADGSMEVVSDRDYTADELVTKGVWQAFSFGPALVENGAVAVDVDTEVGKAMASNPRTAIGVIDNNHFVFVVSDGRTEESAGLSVYELASFLQSLGVKTAYNLDGGGSSTMVFNGQIVNKSTTTGRISERSVSDIVYI